MKVFTNAEFISCEDQNRFFSVMAVEKGRIVYTGNEIPEDYSTWAVEDLGGKVVVPAFGDSHIHFESFAFFLTELDLRGAKNHGEVKARINDYRAENPGRKIIIAFGCSAHTLEERRIPNRRELDAMCSDPLIILKYDGHAAVGNSALIENLPMNIIYGDGFDTNTGWFYQTSFYDVVDYVTKSVSIFKVLKNLDEGADYLARKGIGFFHSAEGVGYPLDMDVDLLRMASHGLPQSVTVFFQTMDEKKVLKRKLPRIGGCFDTALDGCFGSADAALKEPYANSSRNNGVLFYKLEEVCEFLRRAHSKGLQVALHAIGDAAVEQALKAYEIVLREMPREDHRHIIIHADLMSPAMIKKAADLGICIALQSPFLDWKEEPEEYLVKILGQERYENLIPIKSMIDAGITVANGSDGPCTWPDPIKGIHDACNHPSEKERVSALDALKMHTNWCAKLSFEEAKRGTLTEGKVADFSILDKNPLETEPPLLKNINVTDIYFAGNKYSSGKKSTVSFIWRIIKNKFLSVFS